MNAGEKLQIVLFSFGFKYGTPVDVNYLMDVRFLPNPYWVPELKEKTGKDSGVADYVMQSSEGVETKAQLHAFIDFLITQNLAASKKILRIGIGCTGGRHRSVAVSEDIAKHLEAGAVTVGVFHRDIEKDGKLS